MMPKIKRIAATLSLFAAASPVYADQYKQTADGGAIDCIISKRELTRVSLIGDQFASVSKISTGYPYNDFAVTNEPVRGDIYLSVPDTYTLQRPVSTLGKRQWQDSRASERNNVMQNLRRRYGLFYFFAQSCGACEVMSPIVQSVAGTWSITVRAISTDGGPSRHFPNYTVETTQRSKMGLEPKITPAVVLWDAEQRRAIPIGYGVMSADELLDRIYLLTTKEAGRDY